MLENLSQKAPASKLILFSNDSDENPIFSEVATYNITKSGLEKLAQKYIFAKKPINPMKIP